MSTTHDHDHNQTPHDHDHSSGHSHEHAHAPKDFGRAFALGTALNLGFVIIEALYGFIANSTALLADAGHNLSDVLGLLVAWGAAVLVKRAAPPRFTYGYGSTSVLAALTNAIVLLVAVGMIVLEAVQRFAAPEPVQSGTVMIVAAIGIAINGFTAWLFASGGDGDVNIRGAYLHMMSDALVSLGVVVAALLMWLTGWLWLDPSVSLIISAFIVYGTWGLLREATGLALHAVPKDIDLERVADHLGKLPGVTAIHDLHIWPLSTTETALTCHLVIPAGHPGDAFLERAITSLHTAFEIRHATLQIEQTPCVGCTLHSTSKA